MPTSASPISFALTNGVYMFSAAPGSTGQAEMLLNPVAAPTAGLLKVEAQQWVDGSWLTFGGASAVDMSTATWPIALTDYGHFRAVRFTLTNTVGGTGPMGGNLYFTQNSLQMGVLVGKRALNTQTFDESSVKLGAQFLLQSSLPSIGIGGTYNVVMTTGPLPVTLRAMQMYAQATNVSMQLFKAPTFSAGAALPVLNFSDINAQTTGVTVVGGATVTATGTAWGDPQHVYGSSTLGAVGGDNSRAQNIRILAPSKAYLFQFKNSATLSTAAVDLYLSWVEGVPDLPRS